MCVETTLAVAHRAGLLHTDGHGAADRDRRHGLVAGLKALSDPARLRLLSLIAARAGDEVCVCELTDTFTQSGPTISHHLKVLRDAGLVTSERRGSWVYYRVVPAALGALSQVLDPSTTAVVDHGQQATR